MRYLQVSAQPHTKAARAERTVGSVVRVAVTAVYLDLVWLLACLPILTAPAATVGLLQVVGEWRRSGERPTARALVRASRAHLAPASALGGLFLAVGLVLTADLYAIGRMGEERRIWVVAWLAVVVVASMLLLFAPAAVAEGGTGIRPALSTAMRATAGHPWCAAAGVVCVAVAVAVTVLFPVLGLVTGVATAAAVESLWQRTRA